GVIWYQMLVGDLTTGASADFAIELAEMGVSGNAVALLGRCLSARAERRPATAAVLAQELAALGAATPAPSPAPAPPPPPDPPPPSPAPSAATRGPEWVHHVRLANRLKQLLKYHDAVPWARLQRPRAVVGGVALGMVLGILAAGLAGWMFYTLLRDGLGVEY